MTSTGISIVSLRNEGFPTFCLCLTTGRHLGFTKKLRNSHASAQTPSRAMLARPFRYHRSFMYAAVTDISYIVGVGGIDKFSTSVFFEKILQYYYIPTIGVADVQAPLNNML